MVRSQELFLEATGGFRFGESNEQFQQRVAAIQEADEKIRNPGTSVEKREHLLDELRRLKGMEPDEHDISDLSD